MPSLKHNPYRDLSKIVDGNDLFQGKKFQIIDRPGRSDRWIPAWSYDDRKIRMVVYEALWRYAKHTLGTQHKVRPGMSVRELEKIAAEIRSEVAEQFSSNDKHRQRLAKHIRTTENGYTSRLVSIIYRCYRQRQHACDVAADLDITPDGVRQILNRANTIARRLFPKDCNPPHHTALPEAERAKRKAERNKTAGWNIQKNKKYWNNYWYHNPSTREPYPELRFIAALYNSGVMLAELAAAYGKNRSTLYVQLKKFQLIDPARKNRGQFSRGPYRCQRNGDA